MRIGEIAKQAGLNIQSVRFYERKGLLPMPPRSASGYRCYDERHLETIRFIKRGQSLGFTLFEVGQLLELHQSLRTSPFALSRKKSSRESERLVLLARERLEAIEQKIENLNVMQKQLFGFLRKYQSARKLICPATKK
jgi:DNA-binding transcriptional MerR regulator